MMPTVPTAIDPAGCGCTECLTGQYVPLDQATPTQVLKMRIGQLRNNTGEDFEPLPTTVQPTSFAVYAVKPGDPNEEFFAIHVRRHADRLWTVGTGSHCYGPDDLVAHKRVAACQGAHRYDEATAIDIARAAAPHVTHGAFTIVDALRRD